MGLTRDVLLATASPPVSAVTASCTESGLPPVLVCVSHTSPALHTFLVCHHSDALWCRGLVEASNTFCWCDRRIVSGWTCRVSEKLRHAAFGCLVGRWKEKSALVYYPCAGHTHTSIIHGRNRQPINESIHEALNQPAKLSTNPPINKATNETVNPSTDDSTNRLADQPTSPPSSLPPPLPPSLLPHTTSRSTPQFSGRGHPRDVQLQHTALPSRCRHR